MSNTPMQSPESWYSPQTRAEPREPEKKKKKRRAAAPWRAVLGVLLIVGLIVGSSLYFSGGEPGVSVEVPILVMPTPRGEKPDDGPADEAPAETPPADLFPDDWKKFFESYFSPDNSKKIETHIPKAASVSDWQLELQPAGETERSLQEVYRGCVDSIVAIRTYLSGKIGYYWGSGIIMSEDGLILTNAHLLEGCSSAAVTLADNETYDAELVGIDSDCDLAVLKIDARGLTPAAFGDSGALSVGDRVAAIGNPLGEEFRATLTDGIVSAISRDVSYNGRSVNLIQTNTAINEGNSGGALVNMYGQVIGVTNMKMVSRFSSIEGIAFAIPSATVRSIANALIRDGEVRGRTALGITVGAVASVAAEHYDLPEGLYVSEIAEGSDAAVKGLCVGDIILAVDGKPVKTPDDMVTSKEDLHVGDVLVLTVWRDGEQFDLEVALVDYNDVY